jgi:hypothetical protein
LPADRWGWGRVKLALALHVTWTMCVPLEKPNSAWVAMCCSSLSSHEWHIVGECHGWPWAHGLVDRRVTNPTNTPPGDPAWPATGDIFARAHRRVVSIPPPGLCRAISLPVGGMTRRRPASASWPAPSRWAHQLAAPSQCPAAPRRASPRRVGPGRVGPVAIDTRFEVPVTAHLPPWVIPSE